MTYPTHPTLDPVAAQRWQLKPRPAESAWLHEEVARRMMQRLDCIKLQPQSWLHWAPLRAGLQTHAALATRYAQASCTIFESNPALLQQAQSCLQAAWWKRWQTSAPQFVTEVSQPVQMLWANMGLHLQAQPQVLLAQWHQALEVGGFLMFSCLGPDTLKELRALYAALGWPPPAHDLTDMHDVGDMLLEAGFAEPVMDMEHINLSFETPQRLLHELRGLGRNLHVGRFASLRARQWQAQLLQAIAEMPLQLSFEVVYGHAIKTEPRLTVQAHSEISLETMRQALARRKAL
jgi:malonyl-CoA O-methyltransferase